MIGKGRGKWDPKLFILLEILSTNKEKVTLSFPSSAPEVTKLPSS